MMYIKYYADGFVADPALAQDLLNQRFYADPACGRMTC
jgi:hypothetical protein